MEKRILYEGGQAEIIEKKSRFIANTYPIKTEAEALEKIAGIRKEHWDARHNCYAYVCGEKSELQRFSDDGEPSGTAGKPILEVLMKEEVHDTLIVVTRYFGGILLGAGGLVRAYAKAAKAGLVASQIAVAKRGREISILTSYQDHGKFQNAIEMEGYALMATEFTEQVELKLLVELERVAKLEELTANLSSGKATVVLGDECQFGEIEGRAKRL